MLNDIHFVQIPAISILRVPSFCSSSSQRMEGLLDGVALIPELSEIVKPELSHLLSELRNRTISEVLKLFQ